ncbi:MAG: hypothetical protein JAZ13_07300 [Candidatus Thiodiazotropha taylori]|nr:hypothetical protein [Candidatus Thiodiazotropha taylori]
MNRSVIVLRQASSLVQKHLKRVPHFVSICREPIDSSYWQVSQDSVIEICRDAAAKLLDESSDAEQKARSMMASIQKKTEGYFFKNIYQSPNWGHAHSLLSEFSTEILRPQIRLAQSRLEYLENYHPEPLELDITRIYPIDGDYHPDIEKAIDKLHGEFSTVFPEMDVKERTYSILLLIYGSCFAIKEWFDVEMHSSAWNTFKASLESHFIEKAGMPPGVTKHASDDAGCKSFAHYVPECWNDMELLEEGIFSAKSRKQASELYCALLASPSVSKLFFKQDSDRTLESLLWLLRFSGTNIVPKVLQAFGDDDW